MFKHALYIGRFQPPHLAHLQSIQFALEHADQLLILLGSSNLARSHKNPFTVAERRHLLRESIREYGQQHGLDLGPNLQRLQILALPDFFNSARWAWEVQQMIERHLGSQAQPVLVGLEKDTSSAYLQWFPDWERLPVPHDLSINATDIRTALWSNNKLPSETPQAVLRFLESFQKGPHFTRLQAEWNAVQKLKSTLTPPLLEERWVWYAGEHIWLQYRTDPIGQDLLAFPSCHVMKVPAHADQILKHMGRSIIAPSISYIQFGEPQIPSFDASNGRFYDPSILTELLKRPQQFFEDHGVFLESLM